MELTLSCSDRLLDPSGSYTSSANTQTTDPITSSTTPPPLTTCILSNPPSAPHTLRAALNLSPNRVFAASLENALALGFNLGLLFACRGDYISPFYQPAATPQSDPQSLLATASASASLSNGGNPIPLHLRPTMAQVLIPHPAGLDLIPIPFFRERAIVLSAALPETFRIWELQRDIFQGDGLMFWEPAGRLGLGWSENSGGGGMFQPWDMRSWEAAPWFLKKWRVIFGGREHGFWKQSVWWNSLRVEGEEVRPG